MSATGLDVFDKTLQSTHTWLNEIGEVIGPDKQRCYHALRAVLHALRDRLTVEEASHLGAQLPILVRGIYYDGYRPAGKPVRIRSQDEFLDEVAVGFTTAPGIDARQAAIAVFRVLDRHVSPGEMQQVLQSLPMEIRALFPQDSAA
ncbi:MAG TPA: DUF2267 domain-containing protein [Microvirga sp.]|jgi:uncharacterized protein (DUF2267 family)|nr:DUF2267 domain-containing protein [Microvirga sp.]